MLIMAGRLAWVQVVRAEEIVAREEQYRLQREALVPLRGALRDRNGRPLAVSLPTRNLVASPKDMEAKNFKRVAEALAPLLGQSAAEIEQKLAERPDSRFAPLAKGLDLKTAEQIQQLNLPGLTLLASSDRKYPQGSTANQLIGYLDYEGAGAYGLEAYYEKELKGQEGFVRAEMTYDQVPIEETVKSRVDSKPGLDLTLTIDAQLHQTFEAALARVVKEQEAKRGLAIAMDVKTGEILAMAMAPGADLSDRQSWLTPDGKLDDARLTNWAITPLPPGSIFKTITTSIALEERAIDLNTTIMDSGSLVIDGWKITNWDQIIPLEPKAMTIAELLQNSSNIGLMQVGQRIDRNAFVNYLRSFGFMETTGLDFPGEYPANGLSGFDEKLDIDWANMYIGQHLEVTPIQMVTAVAAIANDGWLVKPHLVREMRTPEGDVVWKAPTGSLRQPISTQTAKEVQELMVSVVEEGTGSAARVSGYTVGGKTGTAQKITGGKERGLVADFVGFAPAEDPRVALMILIDEPKPPGYGGQIAAPLFSELMPHVLRTMGIAPASEEQAVTTQPAESAVPVAEQVKVPDLRYIPLAWAEQKLKDAGLALKPAGEGPVVIAQSPIPGAVLKVGSEVELTMGAQPADKRQVPDFRGLTLGEATRLAGELDMTLKQAGGSGFVVEQEPLPGGTLGAGDAISVRLSPTRDSSP